MRQGRSFHVDLIQAAYDEGRDPVRVTARVLGESWAFHQLAAHDYGVLASFLDEYVGGELAEHAALARSWVDAPMGGYRVDGRASACALLVRDLEDEHVHEVLDLGAACLAGLGGTVIGRLVPSGTTPALMFDTAPLPLHRVMTQLREGRDEVGRAAYRILQRASEGALDDDAAAYVGAVALNVHAQEDARRRILSPGQQRHWVRWARLVPPPARTRLLAFAEATAEAG